MLQRMEMDEHVPLGDQLAAEVGPVTLINTFKVAPEDADALLAAWAADAAYLKTKPGFISTQLYRGIAGSGVFVNQAVWESVVAFRNAFGDPQFQATFARYPDSPAARHGARARGPDHRTGRRPAKDAISAHGRQGRIGDLWIAPVGG
jgi:heme-degrading monooxygenase HmoA